VRESNNISELRAAVARVPGQESLSCEQAVSHWAQVARELLQAFGWPGSLALNSEEFQCTQSWSELVAEIASLDVLDFRCNFRAFVARLQRAAASRNFKPETLNAPVQIMDVGESAGSVFDCLWIAGCTDERWPDSPRLSPLIPVTLLVAAGAPVPCTAQDDERVARVTRQMLQAAPRVTLSLALRSDDDREQRWSPLFERVPLASESIRIAPSLAESFTAVELEAVRDRRAPALQAGEPVRGGTTLLKDQSNCPFRAFAVSRLMAKEEQGPSEALAATERGNIVERALQLIWERLKNSDGLADPKRGEIVAEAVEQAMRLELPKSADAWTERFRQLERQRTIELVEEWLDEEARRQPFAVVAHQLPIEVELAGMRLRGRLDRLDKVGDSHLVIDYKSGASDSVSAWRVPRPEKPQLPFYAVAMLQKNLDVAGVAFASVRRGECAFRAFLRDQELLPSSPPGRSFDGISFDDYALLWVVELERLAIAFMQGEAAVDPRLAPGKSKSPCTHCHLQSLCRVQHIAQGVAEEESEEGHE
jgi:ATP-dependent helicase/nuclease subunit B